MERIWDEFLHARWGWIVLSMFFGVLGNVFRALRWNLLIRALGYPCSTSRTFYAMMTGYLANLLVPRLGEVTRCAVLAQKTKVPFNNLVGTVVAERGIDMLTLLGIIFFTILFQFAFLKSFLGFYVLDPLLDLLHGRVWVLVLVLLFSLMLMAGLFLGFLRKMRSEALSPFFIKLKRLLRGFWNGMKTVVYMQKKTSFIGYTVLIWFCYLQMVYLIFFALPATSTLGLADGFTVLALGSLGVVAPVPGGIGTYHFIVIKTLTELLAVETAPAISYAYISHAAQTLVVLLLGGFSWLMLTLLPNWGEAAKKDSVEIH